MLFVVCTMMEFIIVLLIKQRISLNADTSNIMNSNIRNKNAVSPEKIEFKVGNRSVRANLENDHGTSGSSTANYLNKAWILKHMTLTQKTDFVAFFVFIIVYIGYNLIYFSVYLFN